MDVMDFAKALLFALRTRRSDDARDPVEYIADSIADFCRAAEREAEWARKGVGTGDAVPEKETRSNIPGTLFWYEIGRCWKFMALRMVTRDPSAMDVDHTWDVDAVIVLQRDKSHVGKATAVKGTRPGHPDGWVVTEFSSAL